MDVYVNMYIERGGEGVGVDRVWVCRREERVWG